MDPHQQEDEQDRNTLAPSTKSVGKEICHQAARTKPPAQRSTFKE